jgi:hypothetical protein
MRFTDGAEAGRQERLGHRSPGGGDLLTGRLVRSASQFVCHESPSSAEPGGAERVPVTVDGALMALGGAGRGLGRGAP